MKILYLLENQLSSRHYVGITENLDRRIKEHNSKNRHYTSKIHGGWRLVGHKSFDNSIKARQEETRLKRSKNKRYIRWYFDNQNTKGA